MRIMQVASFLFVASALTFGCSKSAPEGSGSNYKPAPSTPADPGPATLVTHDNVVGTGAEAKPGDKVKVHYTGWLLSAVQFDSSVGKDPFEFTLGKGEVIKGWDEGVKGMKVGGKRTLLIPAAMGYGDRGSPPKIPAKAGLKFEVELLGVTAGEGK